MYFSYFIIISILVFINIVSYVSGYRTKDQMYEVIGGSSTCFRRMNATHQIGCSSNRKGSTGVVHFCETLEDLDFILQNGTAAPYIPILPNTLFNLQVVNKIIASELVSGILLYKSNVTPSYFTHENKCPNVGYNLDNTCNVDWNPHGTGLLYQDLPFPVFYIDTDENVKKVRDCYKKFNDFDYEKQGSRSLCSLQMNAFMYGTTDTPTCLRRSAIVKKVNMNPPKYCDPLGDQNVWSTLFPLTTPTNKTNPWQNGKYIILSARIDTTSMFDQTAGATNPITGLVGMLSTAKLLKTILPKDKHYGMNVLFVLFNGETYDYIGSQRFFYDMRNRNFPIKGAGEDNMLPVIRVEDIELLVEFSQLGNSEEVIVHFPAEASQVTKMIDNMNAYRGNLSLTSNKGTMPPSSAQTFLKRVKNLPTIVLANHKAAYLNHYYNSIYDNASNINFEYYNETDIDKIPNNSIQMYLASVANMTAKSIYTYITGNKYLGNETADVLLINELLHCYLENPDCKVHQAIQRLKLNNYVINLYVGVSDPRSQNPFTTLVGLTLGWFTADDIGVGNSSCVNEPRHYAYKMFNMSKSIEELNTTRCFRVSMNFTEALSPAFIIPDYDWSSGRYSSWSESTWNDISIRLFLRPSPAHEAVTMSIGVITFLISLLLVYFFKSRSEILFGTAILKNSEPPANC